MPYHRTLLQDHHGIEQQTLKNSELLAKLQQVGKFDIHAPENRLFLPANAQFAHALLNETMNKLYFDKYGAPAEFVPRPIGHS